MTAEKRHLWGLERSTLIETKLPVVSLIREYSPYDSPPVLLVWIQLTANVESATDLVVWSN